MKPKFIFHFVLINFLLLNSCIKDPDAIGNNLLDDPSIEIITVKSKQFTPQGSAYSDIKVFIETLYDQLPAEQQSYIVGIVLYVNGNPASQWDLPRDWFVENDKQVGSTRCYSFAFKTTSGGESKRSAEHCFVVE